MSSFDEGKWVWFRNPEENDAICSGRVVSCMGASTTVKDFNGKQYLIKNDKLRAMSNSSVEDVDDMITLQELHEGSLFHNLYMRYVKDLIYTYTGNILVSVNPYKNLPLYTIDLVRKYKGAAFGELPPHIFAIANETLACLRKTGENQCIVISGESGAGKTESTKVILHYLATATQKTGENDTNLVQDQILDASPILEAFGNAKTVRNDNSSRFGKFMEVQLGIDETIKGAKMLDYLLERSRIIKQSPNERNYHIFYHLLAGASDSEKAKWYLTKPEDYHYLNQSDCYKVKDMDDAQYYKITKDAMKTLKFGEKIDTIMQILASILNLGNINFVVNDEEEESENSAIKDDEFLNIASELLGIDKENFRSTLTTRTTTTRGEKFVTPLTVEQATDSRDALAKALYGRMFSHIVKYINDTVKSDENLSFIGVLDIFGFEDFDVNSFEQFSINYANERLQYFFNHHIFKLEQEEYDREEINWKTIEFVDNQACIDMISKKPMGLIFLLDEESNFPKATDKTLIEKFHSQYSKHPFYVKPKLQSNIFGIKHYAGVVNYTIDGFLEKNRDTLRADLMELMNSSSIELVSSLFDLSEEFTDFTGTVKGNALLNAAKNGSNPNLKGSTGTLSRTGTLRGKSSRPPTTSAIFHNSLSELILTLSQCNPFFIRCIKPNKEKQPKLVDREMVMSQLRYSGMLETIRIRSAGYTLRIFYKEFISRYKIIVNSNVDVSFLPEKEAVNTILKEVNASKELYQCGKTKVFMKTELENKLDSCRDKKLAQFICKIQSVVRMFLARKQYIQKKILIKKLEDYIFSYIQKKHFEEDYKKYVLVQTAYRGLMARKEYKRRYEEHQEELRRQELEKQRIEEEKRKAEEERKRQEEEERKRKEEEEEREMQKLQEQLEAAKKKEKEASMTNIDNTEDEDDGLTEEERKHEEELIQYLEKTAKERERKANIRRSRMVQNETVVGRILPNDLEYSLSFEMPTMFRPSVFENYIKTNNTAYYSSGDENRIANNKSDNEIHQLSIDNDEASFNKYAKTFFRDNMDSKYTEEPLKTSLFNFSGATNSNAVAISRAIYFYITNELPVEFKYHVVNFICDKIYTNSMLIDETYCQICKATNENPNKSMINKCFELFVILSSIAAPTSKFLPHFKNYLSNFVPKEISNKILENIVRSNRYGTKRSGYSSLEMISNHNDTPIVLNINFYDGTSENIEITSSTTTDEVVKILANKKGIPTDGYTIFGVSGNKKITFSQGDFILDNIYKFEKNSFKILDDCNPDFEKIRSVYYEEEPAQKKEVSHMPAINEDEAAQEKSKESGSAPVEASQPSPPPAGDSSKSAPPPPPGGLDSENNNGESKEDVPPMAKLAPPPPPPGGSDSDSDNGESKEDVPSMAKLAPPPPPPGGSDSDSDNGESKEDVPSIAKLAPPPPPPGGSDSESDNGENEEDVPPMAKLAPPPPPPAAAGPPPPPPVAGGPPKLAPPPPPPGGSDSESDNGESEEDVPPMAKLAPPPPPPAAAGPPKLAPPPPPPGGSDSESDNSESEEDVPPMAKLAPPPPPPATSGPPKLAPPPPPPGGSDSESEEDVPPIAKLAPPPPPPTKPDSALTKTSPPPPPPAATKPGPPPPPVTKTSAPPPPPPAASGPPPPPPVTKTSAPPPPPPAASGPPPPPPVTKTSAPPPPPPAASGPPPPPPVTKTSAPPPPPPAASGPPPPPPITKTSAPPPPPPTASGPPPPPPITKTSAPPPPPVTKTSAPPPPPITKTSAPPPPPPVTKTSAPPPPPITKTSAPPPPPPVTKTSAPPPPPPVTKTSAPPPPPMAKTAPPPPPPITKTSAPPPPPLPGPPFVALPDGPATNENYPWKLYMRKGYVMPHEEFINDLDLELTCLQILQDSKEKNGNTEKLKEFYDANEKMKLINNSLNWSLYFYRRFDAKEKNFPNKNISLGIDTKGVHVIEEAFNNTNILLSCKFDDLIIVSVNKDSISLVMNEKLYSFNTKGIAVGNAIEEYMNKLKQISTNAIALKSFIASDSSQLSFQKDDIIHIIEKEYENGWYLGEFDGKTGVFPAEYVELLIDPVECDDNGKAIMSSAISTRIISNSIGYNSKEINNNGISNENITRQKEEKKYSIFNDHDEEDDEENLDEMEEEEALNKFILLEFAKDNFVNDDDKSFQNTFRARLGFGNTLKQKHLMLSSANDSDWSWRDLVDKIKYVSTPIKTPLTKIYDGAVAHLAVELFQSIMMYMEDLPSKKRSSQIAYNIVKTGMNNESLQDELFCQLFKQITNNKSSKQNSLRKGWELINICCNFIVPSPKLEPYIVKYLTSYGQDNSKEFSKIASDAYKALNLAKLYPRQFPPMEVEITSILSRTPIRRKIYFPEQTCKTFEISTHTTSKEILQNIFRKYDIEETNEYGLYVILSDGFTLMPIFPNELMMDCFYTTDLLLEQFLRESEQQSYHIMFYRKLWYKEPVDVNDSLMNLIFHEVRGDFCSGNIFSANDLSEDSYELVCKIIAGFVLVSIKSNNSSIPRVGDENCGLCSYQQFIPEIIFKLYEPERWESTITKYINSIEDMPIIDVIRTTINHLKEMELFGCSFFNICASNDSRFSSGGLLCIDAGGIRVLDNETRKELANFDYNELINYKYDDYEFVMRVGNLMKKKIIRVQTNQGLIIVDLIDSYVKYHIADNMQQKTVAN